MIIDKTENIVTITQEKLGIVELVKSIDKDYDRFKNNNIIVNITTLKTVELPHIVEFLQLSNTHRANKHSFVIVSETADLDTVPDEIMVVRTLQEAYDIIEMESMERDLGF